MKVLRYVKAWPWALAAIMTAEGAIVEMDVFVWHRGVLLVLMGVVAGCTLIAALRLHARIIRNLERRNLERTKP